LSAVQEQYHKAQTPCSLLMIDIDHFKSINDEFGHDVGDQALISFVSQIHSLIRQEDYFARWGGEEFVLICPGTSLHFAKIIAEKIRVKIETTQLIKQKLFTCSIGIAELSAEEIVDWFKRADKALYLAKNSGRNSTKTLQVDEAS